MFRSVVRNRFVVTRLLAVAALGAALAACGSTSSPSDPSTSCPVGAVAASPHSGSLNANETWSGVHEVSGTVTLSAGVTLTIAPCAEIRFAPNAGISLTYAGAHLEAVGEATRPIRFVRRDAASPWSSVFVWAPASATLAHVTLDGGGTSTVFADADYKGATLVGRGDSVILPVVLKVTDVVVSGSNGLGVMLVAARFDPTSTNLTIKGAGWFPIYLGADCASELPAGTYTGNAIDEILLQSVSVAVWGNSRPLVQDVTMHNRGVPYRVGSEPSSIIVGDSKPTSTNALLTIEAGVKLRFATGGSAGTQLEVQGALRSGAWESQGALVVAGTATDPVVFTSAAAVPAAGDWQGLYFKSVVDARSRVDYAVIEYAGGDSLSTGVCVAKPGAVNSDADCSVIMALQSDKPPAQQFITHTRIANGLGCGFYRNWQVVDLDFRPTNEFVNITGCAQSVVPNALNVCVPASCTAP